MTLKNSLTLLFCFFSILGGPQCLIGAPKGAGVAEESYIFHVMYLSDVEDRRGGSVVMPGINLKFELDGEMYQLSAVRNALSRAFRYAGSNVLDFVEEVPGPDGEEPIQQVIASVKMGRPGTKIIMIVKKSSGKFASFALDVSEGFKQNHMRIINFSDRLVYAKVDDAMRKIEPSKMEDFRVKGVTQRFLVQVGLAAQSDDVVEVFGKKRMAMKVDGRKLLIVHNHQRKVGKLTYKEIYVPDPSDIKENVSDEELKPFDNSIYQDYEGDGDSRPE